MKGCAGRSPGQTRACVAMKTSDAPELHERLPRRPTHPRASRKAPTDDVLARRPVRIYRTMLLSRRIDDKEIQLKNQSLIFFQISGAGHEAILVAAGLALQAGLRLVLPVLPRPRALPRARHDAARDVPRGRRRQGRPEQRRPPDAVALGPQGAATSCRSRARPARSACRPSAAPKPACSTSSSRTSPAASRSSRRTKSSTSRSATARRAKASSGSRSSTACVRQLPVVFLVEDNGYAISVPGRSADARRRHLDARRVVSRASRSCAATAPTSSTSYRAMQRGGRLRARARKGPALVHAKVIRPYSHSLSDDEQLYKTPAERADGSEARSDHEVRARS